MEGHTAVGAAVDFDKLIKFDQSKRCQNQRTGKWPLRTAVIQGLKLTMAKVSLNKEGDVNQLSTDMLRGVVRQGAQPVKS